MPHDINLIATVATGFGMAFSVRMIVARLRNETSSDSARRTISPGLWGFVSTKYGLR